MFNIEGKSILNCKVSNSIDLSFLPKGVYVVRLNSGKETQVVSKLLKL
ncbi:MAG: T9SS type A sorting domain-containing protein [Paludibacteraceae bacterium]